MSQSSDLNPAYPATKANDGSLGTSLSFSHTSGAAGVCNQTTTDQTPWWMVDFGYTASIGGGKIWGRQGCCQARLNGFQIWVGNSSTYNAAGNTNCYFATSTEHTLPPYTHTFSCLAFGRYLFVVQTTGQCLTMREIEIYSVGTIHYLVLFMLVGA